MRENMEHALIGSREGQPLPDYVRTYSEGTRGFQIKSLCYKSTELKSNLTELNNKFKNDDWCDTSDMTKLFYWEHKKSGYQTFTASCTKQNTEWIFYWKKQILRLK